MPLYYDDNQLVDAGNEQLTGLFMQSLNKFSAPNSMVALLVDSNSPGRFQACFFGHCRCPPIKEIKRQPRWIDYGFFDLRTLERELRSAALDEVEAADSHEAAIGLLAQYLVFC